MDDTTHRKIERAEAELDRLLTHFPDIADPIAVGWLALRVERWRKETRPGPGDELLDCAGSAGGVERPRL
ncbi:MAG: hypothetical protein JRI25_18150 [Deltaproteobacteria bacterium]|nr:hypothetical protein [Deltaproteobacteria bacterium]